MQATIYVTTEAFTTANQLKDLDYYDRLSLADNDENDVSRRAGYYLKNANELNIAVLPHGAKIAVHVTPANSTLYNRHIALPPELRGCIFEKAPRLPNRYAEIVTYWSGKTVNAKDGGAVYFQNPANEYMVDLTAIGKGSDDQSQNDAIADMDDLLSEGVVISITGLGAVIAHLPLSQFVEIEVPVDESILGTETGKFRSTKAYDLQNNKRSERFFLRILDILRSPDPDHIYIDLLRHELLDYGYFY